MAAFVKYNSFAVNLAAGNFTLTDAGSQIKVALSNTAGDVVPASHSALGTITQISYANCNLIAQQDTINVGVETPAGTWDVSGSDVIITATGAVAQFRYIILYDELTTTPVDALIGSWDYGSGVDLANGETFTINFGASMFTVT